MAVTRGSQKHEREAVRRIELLSPGLRAHVESRGGSVGHKWLVATLGSTTVRVNLASSPSCADHALNSIRQKCQRAFRERGVQV